MRKYIFIFLIAAIFIVLFAVIRKKKANMTKKLLLVIIPMFILLLLLAIYPFETQLLSFETPAQALNYIAINESIAYQVDVSGGAFLICNIGGSDSSRTVHTLIKENKYWKIPASDDTVEFFNTPLTVSEYANKSIGKLNFNGSFVYNSTLNKTLVEFVVHLNMNKNIVIADQNDNEFTMYSTKSDSLGGYDNRYFMVLNGAIPKSFCIAINNESDIKVK